jgi:hypothetical protein
VNTFLPFAIIFAPRKLLLSQSVAETVYRLVQAEEKRAKHAETVARDEAERAREHAAVSDQRAEEQTRAWEKAEAARHRAEVTARQDRLEAQAEVQRVHAQAAQNRKDAAEAQQKVDLLLREKGHLTRAPADLRNDHALARALHVSHPSASKEAGGCGGHCRFWQVNLGQPLLERAWI